jgi:Fic/DOC family
MALVLAKEDKTQARRLQRLAAAGHLRRLYAGVYTDDLVQPLDSIVRREILALCSVISPGSIISHRSALEGGRPTAAGNLFVTGANRRDLELPGVKLRIVKGAGPLDSDIRIPTFAGDAFISSQARALLENLTSSRGVPTERRTLGTEGVEDWLARFVSRDISRAINKIRDVARSIAGPLELEAEFKQLEKIIGALLGTQRTHLTAPAAIARAAGKPYDDARVTLFQALATELQSNSLQVPLADPKIDSNLQAFIETYFSNYIEGTEFEIEEAHDIVVQGRPLKYREDDSHDILGTYRAILESKATPIIPRRFEDFAKQLQDWNREVIESRQSKSPGEFKSENNRAGNTVFVTPELVVGTLEKGYELIMSIAAPANRAALAMFVVAEVHPFTDGNGRTARLAMNLFLTEAGLTRIIIPTVYRDDYISALKAMSTNSLPTPLVRMLGRAARFSRWVNMSSKEIAFADLKRSNAMGRPETEKLSFDHSAAAPTVT